MVRKVIVFLLIFFTLASCTNQTQEPGTYFDGKTYSSLFEAYWHAMNENYIFWYLDSQGFEWDEVYDEYMPKFMALGDIDASKTNTALRYFFDISTELSDGHYSLLIEDTNTGLGMQYINWQAKAMRSLGLSDDIIFDCSFFSYDNDFGYIFVDNPYDYEEFNNSEYVAENTASVAENIFNVDLTNKPFVLNQVLDVNEVIDSAAKNFSTISYAVIDGFYVFLGETDDGILYFSFNSYSFSSYSEKSGVNLVLNQFIDKATSDKTKGIIIDLRGNSGGYNYDLALIFQYFVQSKTHYCNQRTKTTSNRLDYNAWVPVSLYPASDGRYVDPDIPIAVLVNNMSASNGEIALYIMKALQEQGREIRTFGSNTMGAIATISGSETNDIYNSGSVSFSNNGIYLSFSTPEVELSYTDGTVHEGIGITPDEVIPFDFESFIDGIDSRLDAAYDYVKSR